MAFSRRDGLQALTSFIVAAVLADGRPANAILNYYIYENAGRVIVETSGSLNVGSPTGAQANCGASGYLVSSGSFVCTGVDSLMDQYELLSAASFGGSASLTSASAVSGISTTLAGDSEGSASFFVEIGYTNNAPIVSSAIFDGQSLSGLGFNTPGVVGTWTLSASGDTINVLVGAPPAPSAVPGPLPLFGAAAAFGYSRRLRRRVNQCRSASSPAAQISA